MRGADTRTGVLGTVGHGLTTRLDQGVAGGRRDHGVGIAVRSDSAGDSAAGAWAMTASARAGAGCSPWWSPLTSASADAMVAFNSPTVRAASAMSRSRVDTIARSSPVSIRDG
ncbi:hypothetical protein ACW9HC_12930 [Nocardia gipuzkoensis]